MVSIKSIKQGKQFLDCFIRPLALPKQIVSMPSIWLRSFLISFEQPNIGLPSWRLKSALIRREPIAPSNGYTGFTPRLRTDFYARTMAVVERLSAGRARVEQL